MWLNCDKEVDDKQNENHDHDNNGDHDQYTQTCRDLRNKKGKGDK